MKKPILLGFTALCVLSTPNIVDQFSYSSAEKSFRTIASDGREAHNTEKEPTENEEETQNLSIDGARESLSAIIDRQSKTRESLKEIKEVTEREKEDIDATIAEIDRDLKKIKDQVNKHKEESDKEEDEQAIEISKEVTKEEENLSALKEEVAALKVIKRDVTVCEFRNEIDELSAQIKDLLKDKEKAIAKVEEGKEEKKDKEDKKDNDRKDSHKEEANFSRYQQLLSMGMVFGRGFQQSFQMPGIGHFTNPFMNFNPMFTFNNGNSSWLNLMQRDFSGVQKMINHSSSRVGESATFNQFVGASSHLFVPKFNRTTIEAETISFN
ncbi:hypothetical protein [Halobacteriovorax marinus]|uniref:hypothetical protein n=1 Tax=Halobacteriovorax marinus TaxID=97084 RepID=UPI003A903C56